MRAGVSFSARDTRERHRFWIDTRPRPSSSFWVQQLQRGSLWNTEEAIRQHGNSAHIVASVIRVIVRQEVTRIFPDFENPTNQSMSEIP